MFKDIWGSDLIFAGPHKTFTDANKMSNINHVIYGIHSMIREPEHDVEQRTDEREYAMITNSEIGLSVNPFPLNPADIIDVGGRVTPDFEELVDRDNHFMKDYEPIISQHFCGAHKAIIPIARMRKLVDEDDTTDTITYRCPDCSKSMVCKRSRKQTAVS